MNLTEDIQPGTLAPPTEAPRPSVPPPDDPRVVQALDEYAAALKAGQRPDRHEFQARYPEVAAALAECLEGLEFVQAAAPLLQPPAGGYPAATSATAAEFRPEGPLGDYRIVREIGRGGMGVVYEAMQISLGRRVALKVLPFAGALDAKHLQRFKNEAQAAAHLHHQNIVPVHGVGCDRGVHYYAMQFIDGQTLAAMIAELRPLAGLDSEDRTASTPAARGLAGELASGRWAPRRRGRDNSQLTGPYPLTPSSPEAVAAGGQPTPAAADMPTQPMAGVSTERSTKSPAFFRTVASLGVQAAEALEHAHGLGVVHRDIKPANLLLDRRGNLWITDFGLAHCHSQAGLTMTGDLVGTLRYMSPEQALAQRLGVDHRTDVYSLGATLYELLTLEPVFDGRDRQELLRQIAFEEPKSPRRLNRAIPAELETIVLKAMEKSPADRYATAQELADDLGRFLKDESIRAKRPSLVQRACRWARRHQPIVWSVLAATLAVLLLAVGMLAVSNLRINEEQRRTEEALEEARHEGQEKTEQLWQALLAQAQARRYSRQMGQRLDSLATLEKAAHIRPDERLRDEAMAAMALPDIRLGPLLHATPAGTKGIAFDGRYQTYAQIDDQGVISIRSIPDNEEIRCIKTKTKSEGYISLSPNGQFLAALDNQHALQLWRIADGKPLLREELRQCLTSAFSPDSRRLAVAKDDWVFCIDLASGQETSRWRLPAAAYRLAFDPNNRRLAVGYSNSTVASIYDSAQGSHVADLPVGLMDHQVVAWHPDGARLAVAGSDPHIQIWDVVAKRKLATLEGHVHHVRALDFHPDGGLLASRSFDGTLRLWDPATGRQLMQLPLGVDFQSSTTGKWVGWLWRQIGGQRQLVEVIPSREYRTIVSSLGAGQGDYHEGDISPDGRLLALGMGSAGDRLWDLASGRELAVLPSGGEGLLFQPNGRELLTCGTTGLHRWSIQDSKEAANELRLGPARKIALPAVPHRAARSSDGRTLAIVSGMAGAGLIMDLTTESVQGQTFAHPGAAFVALSRDGRWVASSGWHSDRVRLWNAQTGTMVHEWVLGKEGTAVYFTPDSRSLIICRGDAFTFWDVETLQPIRRLERDVALYPGYVAFSQDGRLMALEMAPAVIHLMEVATGRTVAKLEDPHGDRAGWMSFTPDGTQLVVTAPYAKAVHVWDLRAIRGRLKAMDLDWDWDEFPPAGESAGPRPPSAAPTIRIISAEGLVNHGVELAKKGLLEEAIAEFRKAIEIEPNHSRAHNDLGTALYRAGRWKDAIETLERADQLSGGKHFGHNAFFIAMSHWQLGNKGEARKSHDRAAQWMITHDPANGELRQVRADAQELLGIQDHRRFQGHSVVVRAVRYLPDQKRVLSAGHDRTVRVWDLETGKELSCLWGHTDAATSAAISPDGRRALSTSTDGTVRLWDLVAGKELLRFKHASWVECVAFSPDGRHSLCGTHGTLHLWDLDSGKELMKFEGHTGPVRSLAISPDGCWALSGGHDKTIRRWDLATGKEVRRFEGHTDLVLTVALSPDGTRAVSGGCDQIIRFWDTESGKEIGSFRGHKGNVEALAFSRDGRRLVSGSADGTIRLWDTKDGKQLHVIGTESTFGVAISEDSQQILSAHQDGVVRLWTLPEDRD